MGPLDCSYFCFCTGSRVLKTWTSGTDVTKLKEVLNQLATDNTYLLSSVCILDSRVQASSTLEVQITLGVQVDIPAL